MTTTPTTRRATPAGELEAAVERLAAVRAIEQMTGILRAAVSRLIGADGVALIVRDGDFCHYIDEDAIGPLWKGQKFPMGICISGWSMLKRQTVCIPDVTKDKRVPQDLYAATFVRSLVMTPIRLDPPIGALGAYWAQEYAATAVEIETMETLARATGAAMEHMRRSGPI